MKNISINKLKDFEGKEVQLNGWIYNLRSIFFEINNSLSTYMPNSDISRINNGDTLLRVDNHFKNDRQLIFHKMEFTKFRIK